MPRPNELQALKKQVFADESQKIAVCGMAGVGKSVLATALVWDTEVQQAFPDGILWVTLGTEPSITSQQVQLGD